MAKKHWSIHAEEVHGISWDEAKGFPKPEKFISSFLKELSDVLSAEKVQRKYLETTL